MACLPGLGGVRLAADAGTICAPSSVARVVTRPRDADRNARLLAAAKSQHPGRGKAPSRAEALRSRPPTIRRVAAPCATLLNRSSTHAYARCLPATRSSTPRRCARSRPRSR